MRVMKKYKFALKPLMIAIGINRPADAYHRFFEGRMTRQNVYLLWNRNQKQININTINIICDALGVDPSYLFRAE